MLFDVTAALAEILAQAPATPATIATNTPDFPPVSRVSRVSQQSGPEPAHPPAPPVPPPAYAQTAILAAIQGGCLTPGAIATATRLGATATYHELDRKADAASIRMASNGPYSITI
ncbi:MAG: hypothetical protein ABI832_22890 [bacterium]